MLVVTDDGVKIQLAPSTPPSGTLSTIVITAILLALLGVAIAMGLSIGIAMLLAVCILSGSMIWQKLAKKSPSSKTIVGGEVIIKPYQIEHISHLGQKTSYPLPQQIQLVTQSSDVIITDNTGQTLLTIVGFTQPQHATIAQAVLQGKTIKTQGKSIRMQD